MKSPSFTSDLRGESGRQSELADFRKTVDVG